MDLTTGSFNQLGNRVKMSAGPVIMNRDNRIFIQFNHRPYGIKNPFLHFGVGALNGVQFDRIPVLPCRHRRNGSSAHTNSVVVATQDYHIFTSFRDIFQAILLLTEPYPASLHDHLIIAKDLIVFGMFEGEH